MYVAVKGGEQAIDNAHRLLAHERRGDPEAVPRSRRSRSRSSSRLAVDRVMAEGSLYDPELAALAIKQARGDLIEAIFLRPRLPHHAAALRRIRADRDRDDADPPAHLGDLQGSARRPGARSDLRLHAPADRLRAARTESLPDRRPRRRPTPSAPMPRVTDLLGDEGLIEREPAGDGEPVGDLTREPLDFPADRDLRLQALARGDEGFLLALGYSTQRGYGRTHPFVGEIRIGEVEVEIVPAELGFAVPLGAITLTECQMVNQFHGSSEVPPQFTRGYGLVFGQSERKAMAMALVDRACARASSARS